MRTVYGRPRFERLHGRLLVSVSGHGKELPQFSARPAGISKAKPWKRKITQSQKSEAREAEPAEPAGPAIASLGARPQSSGNIG